MENSKQPIALFLSASLTSAVLLSLPFLVNGLGIFALIAFVPLLFAEKVASERGCRKFWLWHYGTFVLWNALSVFWVCNATLGGGLFAIFANALQMSLVFGLFRASRKVFRGVLPYIFLAVAWIAWEKWYFGTQISFPWLVLGNAFAGSTHLVQWYEFTGSLGGSLWIWACNLAFFGLLSAKLSGNCAYWTKWAKWCSRIGLVLIVLGPMVLSLAIYHSYRPQNSGNLEVVIAQPNFDPYQKFGGMSQQQQNMIAASLIKKGLAGVDTAANAVLVLTPETFTRYIITNMPQEDPTFVYMDKLAAGRPGTNILLGAATKTYYFGEEAPSILAWPAGTGQWFETHNSALILDGTGRSQIFHKSKLVVGTELTPYPRIFVPLDNWLGGYMARDTGQEEISLLDVVGKDGQVIPIGCAICYESVYGEYCTGYVKKGAKAMTIITNDAWWGDTPGYRQHFRYASLRAIELRRDIARCGNTGISGIINSRGDVVCSGPWWEESVINGAIGLSEKITFFVENGDIAGRICSFFFVLLMLIFIARLFIPEHLRK